MALRLGGLADLDPTAAPLPVGTEVTTRVGRAIEAVDNAWPTSVLPTDAPPEAIAALDAWLREVRRAHW